MNSETNVIDEMKYRNVPVNILNIYNGKLTTADEAVKKIKSGDNVVIQPGCAVPLELVRAMVKRKNELEDVIIYHILIVGKLPYVEPGMESHFKHKAFFIGANTRKAVHEGRAEFIPIFLSEVPLLFKRGIIPVDIALLNVSLPDEHGFCSYGVDVGTIKTAAEKAKIICGLDKGQAHGIIHDILMNMINNLNSKIVDSLDFYSNHYSEYGPINEIILCGGGANIKNLEQVISESCNIPVKMGNVFTHITNELDKPVKDITQNNNSFPNHKNSQSVVLKTDISMAYSTAIGLALRGFFIKTI